MSTKVTIGNTTTGPNEGEQVPGQPSLELPMVAPNYQAMPEVPEGGGRDPKGNPQSAYQLQPDSIVTVKGLPMTVQSAVTLGLMKPRAEGGFVETDASDQAPSDREGSAGHDLGGPSPAQVADANRAIASVVGQIGELNADTLVQALAAQRAAGSDHLTLHTELAKVAERMGAPAATVNEVLRAERTIELAADRALRSVGIMNPGDFREWAENDATRLKALAYAGSALALGGDTGPLLGLASQFQTAALPTGNSRLDHLSDSEMEAMAPAGHELVRQGGVVVIRGPSIPVAMPLSQAVAQGYVRWNGTIRGTK